MLEPTVIDPSQSAEGWETAVWEHIRASQEEVYRRWTERLPAQPGDKRVARLEQLQKERRERVDLLSLLLENPPADPRQVSRGAGYLIAKVRTPNYSISDLCVDLEQLEGAIASVVQGGEAGLPKGSRNWHWLIDPRVARLLKAVLRETSEVYEQVFETSLRGVCVFDPRGTILYANARLRTLVQTEALTGKSLPSLFSEAERPIVADCVKGKRRLFQSMRLCVAGQDALLVGAEIGPLTIGGEDRGGFGIFIDISKFMELQQNIFERSVLGILKVALHDDYPIIYANPAATRMLGHVSLTGRYLKDLCTPANYATFLEQLRHRQHGASAEYEVELRRLDDGRPLPVVLAGAPEKDLNGTPIASVGIFRSVLTERTAARIHQEIHVRSSAEELLEGVLLEIGKVIPFQLAIVGIYNPDLTEARALYSCKRGGRLAWERKWWSISEAMRRWVREQTTVTKNDLAEQIRGPLRGLTEDTQFQKLRDERCPYFLRYPVFRENRPVASVTLYAPEAYRDDAVALLQALPLDHAVLTALSYEEKQELQFRLDLLKETSADFHDIQEVGRRIADRLADHYGWTTVAFFVADASRRRLTLLAQCGRTGPNRLPPDYSQSMDEGVMGYACRHGEDVNIGDVRKDTRFREIYVRLVPDTRSELCLTVRNEKNEVEWLLNIEDTRENAFSREEQSAVRRVLDELATLLIRSRQHHLLQNLVTSTSDAVFVLDNDGLVVEAYPGAQRLLGYEPDELSGKSFLELMRDKDAGKAILAGPHASPEEISVVRKDGAILDVLMSVSPLPRRLGGKVVIAKDLLPHKLAERLAALQKVYGEIAYQIKTPLSLLMAGLDRLSRPKHSTPGTGALLTKMKRQLTQVELTYDRLFLGASRGEAASYHETSLDIGELIDAVREDLPVGETAVEFELPDPLPRVKGDFFQLWFCLITPITCLLRSAPEDQPIRVRIDVRPPRVGIAISGACSLPEAAGGAKALCFAKALTEISVGSDVIEQFARNHGGTFEIERFAEEARFRIELPLAKEAP